MNDDASFQAVLLELESLASKDARATAKRRGVPVTRVLGVRTSDLRKLARQLGQNEMLARQLWRSGIHEARVLAILIATFSGKTRVELGEWVCEIDSWDVCDHFAKRVSEQVGDVVGLASSWVADDALYTRRAGLALIANRCMKQHEIDDDDCEAFATLIERASTDDREHVRQACCWALRELGKIDTESHEAATTLALNLLEASDRSSEWVGKCAYKELELLVKIPERRRLISRKSKTASKHQS